MWIQWSLTRLVRWRVKDWASCFTACRFPLEDETDTYRSSSSPPQLPMRSTVFDMKDNESKGKRNRKKLLRRTRSCRSNNNNNICSTRINLGTSTQTRNNNNLVSTEITNDSSWPHFTDEDYIVFCFKEDGAFDVVKDCKSGTPSNHRTDSCDDGATSEEDIRIPVTGVMVDEEEIIYVDAGSSVRSYQTEAMENQEMVSVGSSESSQSGNSSGSFAFPVLGWEWMGSPAQMPKSEGLHLRKHKTISLSFHCCRF
ncbi:protein BREAKING OF ASYMMETRY IN THE STOMATAL LINEAGE-like [Mangifera indica]|uniref:protein BREAKING OF ASYMMETRY IN THE STOMATAL LINEAGE-like n=1 Tax=Mangifera indica TaxID=29780 RepID=UPI001CFBACD5|nr:protein BREAKING OF ASYMMETRY IN THE STOMATAL LINEAGE-like [Mangifera indica]